MQVGPFFFFFSFLPASLIIWHTETVILNLQAASEYLHPHPRASHRYSLKSGQCNLIGLVREMLMKLISKYLAIASFIRILGNNN